MQNGYLKMQKFAHGARRLWRDQWAATSWHAHVVKHFVTCALSHGSLTIKTILNVTYIKKGQIKL
jgi:hypothetical protein